MNILLGEISSYKAIIIAKYLKKNYPDIFIHSFDFRKYTTYLRTRYSDKHHYVRYENIEKYLEKLSNVIKHEEINYFIPVHSNYIGEILKRKELFGKSLIYLGKYEDYKKLHNKDYLINIAKQLEIKIPKRYRNIEQAQVPFIGKPIKGSSAKGVVYFFSEADRRKLLTSTNKLDNYIFQEYIKGVGCGYSVYAINGEIKIGYGHIRLAEFPVSGGSSVYRENFYDNRMKEIAEKILGEIKWTGFAMFEFKLTPERDLVLIEVNPRIWGSINQGLQNGINYFKLIIPKFYVKGYIKKNFRTYLSPQIYLSFFMYLLKGNLTPTISFFRYFRSNKADVNLFSDFRGWLSVVLRNIL